MANQLIPGIGVLFPTFYDSSVDYFHGVTTAHAMQSLTESTKEGVALRTGVYMSHVQAADDGLAFHLLRCSTNFAGPTHNFRGVDRDILDRTNCAIAQHFPEAAPVNHVLAQVYHNRKATAGHKEAKAVIKRHADKTKDMPTNGVIAFATFYSYDGCPRRHTPASDPLDVWYGKASMLTTMKFALKQPDHHPHLPAQVTVKLYPHSLLLIPLTTNQLYTHEIKAPLLPAHMAPTRLGYVMRCSNQRAIHRDGVTYAITPDGEEVPLGAMTPLSAAAVRAAYRQENVSDEAVHYPAVHCSFNSGDYQAPLL